MYLQREFLRVSDTMTRNSTYRLSLPDNGFVTSMLLIFASTPVTDARLDVAKWRVVDFLSKVEVLLNQSTVCKSLTGRMAHVSQWLDGGPLVVAQDHNYGSSTLRFALPIHFGRKFFDAEYGLDLSKWDDVELRVSNDGSSTYFGADHSISVLLNYVRDVPANPFRGYLRTEEWNNYLTVASAKKYLELPTENKIRRVLIQVDPTLDSNHVAQRTPYNTLSNIEFFLKTGLLKMFDGDLRTLWRVNAYEDGRVPLVGAEQYATDAKGFRTGLGQTWYKAGAYLSHDGGQSTYAPDFVPGEDSVTQTRQSDGDSDQWSTMFMGTAPESCAWFRFDDPDVPDSYLDPAAQKTVQLNYSIGTDSNDTDATIRTVLDRLVNY
jgi:hypothetical protein